MAETKGWNATALSGHFDLVDAGPDVAAP